MFIDMHMHEKRYSTDSFLMLEQMVKLAKYRGLDAICITDHDSMGLKEAAAAYSKKVGFPIFVGIEYYSLEGDIAAFGIDDYPKERIHAQDFINYVNEQGGVCFAVHPFRSNRRGLEHNLETIQGLCGVEVLNGSTPYEDTMITTGYAKRKGFATLASSDCHTPDKVGLYATYYPREIKTVEELIEAIKNHECRPAYYKDRGYHLWDMESRIDAPFHIHEPINDEPFEIEF